MEYVDKDGFRFSKDKRTLIKCPLDFKGEYKVPNTVFRIEDGAFDNCTGLTALVIPHSVWEIGQRIVGHCTALTAISIAHEYLYDFNVNTTAFDDCANHCTLYVPLHSGKMYRNHPAFQGFKDISEKQELRQPDSWFADNKYVCDNQGTFIEYQEPHPYTGDNKERTEAMDYICNGDGETGRKRLENLCRQGDLWATHTLAYGFQNGWFGKPQNDLAVDLYRQLCRKEYKWAMSSLAFCYQMGLGVRKNLRCAINWYKKGVALGDDYALSSLACIYLFGPKKYRDIEAGIQLCKKAPKDFAEAYNLLAICNEKGIGMPKNLSKAKRLYKKAIELDENEIYEQNLKICTSI